ncbi:MAG: protein kinase domain-containing protein [Planctomycetota bacterium]|jgi:serine/threonine-protein kinase
MQIYYFKDNWIEGPVDEQEISNLLKNETLNDDSPAWSLSQNIWHPCIEFIESTDETAVIDFNPDKQESLLKDVNSEIPQPRSMLCLKNAYDQELITYNQCERLLGEMMENPAEFKHLAQILHARGWITPAQRKLLDETSTPTTGLDHIGNYELIKELGSGGMGTTYLAKQKSMDRSVALKVLLPSLSRDTEYVRRFEREAKMAAKLNHQNIATAYEVGSESGKHFISMEFIEGATLDQKIEAEGKLDEQTASEIIIQVCDALKHAHEHDLVHRDISPKNIIIRPDGMIKLIDMGLARSISPKASALTTKGTTLGTPAYMSPEQCAGRDDLDIRSDIYSLGCAFYECLTGEPPMVGDTMFETISMHINNEVPSVKEKNDQVSDLICHIIKKMTAKNPDQRYQTPAEVIEGFQTDQNTVRIALDNSKVAPPIDQQISKWENSPSVEIKLKPDEKENVYLVARKLEEKLESMDAGPEFQGYAQTLFAELVANAFDHGCKDMPNGLVTVCLDLNDAFFKIEVEDPGPGFEAQKMLDKIKKEPLNRERRRGIMQILTIADSLEYSPDGKKSKAILYRKTKGSGIFERESDGITYVEVKGKGDLALSDTFRKWVEDYNTDKPERICLLIRTEWVSSMFVGTIGKLHSKLKDAGSALSVWAEHRSCYKVMQQLGVTTFVRIQDSLEQAVFALRYEDIGSKNSTDSKDEMDRPALNAEAKSAEESKRTPATKHTPVNSKHKNPSSNSAKPENTSRRRKKAKSNGGIFKWVKDLFN